MNALYINYISGEIQKQAAGVAPLPGDMSARLLHPTLWSSNPYTGLMMAGGLLGGGAGLLSSDSDENKALRGLAGAGLGLAGTSALNNMGVFDDSVRNAKSILGGKQNAASQTKTEKPAGEQAASQPKAESRPAQAAKGAKAAKGGTKPPATSMDFLSQNISSMRPGQVKDVQKLLSQQAAQQRYIDSLAAGMKAQQAQQLAQGQAAIAGSQAQNALLARRAAAGPAGIGIARRIAMGLPLIGRMF
jgi:hypothetical protein